jgi:hypothetical protein
MPPCKPSLLFNIAHSRKLLELGRSAFEIRRLS